jgi:hypothetical protein
VILRRIALVAVCCLLAVPARADDDARTWFLGIWQGTGTVYQSPYSKAGSATDTTTCGWQAGTTYLVCAQHHVSPDGAGDQLSIYVRSATGYNFTRIDPGGTAYATNVSVSGTAWTYSSNFQDGSHVIQIRTINNFPQPAVEDWVTEYSNDGGKTWRRMAQGTEHRVAAPAPSP